MRRLVLATLILCLVSLACAASLMTPGDYVNEYGGDVNVYTRILGMTDCTELQREFERAEETVQLEERGTEEYKVAVGYRTAVDNRLKEVECKGNL